MERMKKKVWRRRLAAWLIVSLCVGVCPAPVAATAAETVAQTESSDIEQEAQPEEDTAWEDEEVVVELDEDGKDEWGNTCWTSTTQVHFTLNAEKLTKNEKGNYVVRVPDKVILSGKEYTVTEYSFSNVLDAGEETAYDIYVGKNINTIARANYRETFHVHHDNKNFISEKGSVFTKGKQTLVAFACSAYGRNSVYEIPDTVAEISDYAFRNAEIKEVVLNDKIKKIPQGCFYNSSIKRMDLKNVTELEAGAFSTCHCLRELKINCEGLVIGDEALSTTPNLQNLYIPPKTQFSQAAYSANDKMNVLIFDEDVYFSNVDSSMFTGANLETIVLPRNIKKLGGEAGIHDVPKLTKLYIPDSVEEIESGALNAKGNLKIYAKSTSPAADYDDDNVTFVSRDDHKHELEEVTFFQYETWGVKGKYCKECAYAENFEMVDFQTEEDRQNMPELLVYEHECPKVLELDDADTDEQGIIYEFDDITQTAIVAKLDSSRPFPKSIFLVPEKVRKNGKEYVVDTIGDNSMNNAVVVVLPDTVSYLGNYIFRGYIREITLGKNVRTIEDDTFRYCNPHIKFRGENPYFKIVDNVLYDSQMTRLIKYMPHCDKEEYTIPKTVSKIEYDAFFNAIHLKKITVYNRKYIEDNGLQEMSDCKAEIIELEDPDALPTEPPEGEEFIVDGYSWEGGTLEVELDSEYKDSQGFYYNLDGTTKTATLYRIDKEVFETDENELTIRIPDKVRKAGRSYTVTTFALYLEIHDDIGYRNTINLYIGKYITEVSLGRVFYKITSYVHKDNKKFISKKGSLFSRDQIYLYRFCDKELKGTTFTLPSKVEVISQLAFFAADIKEVVFNEKIRRLDAAVFQSSSVEVVEMKNIEVVGYACFLDCMNLQEVKFGTENVAISLYAFARTKSLKNVYIPAGSEVSGAAFEESGVQNIIFGEGTVFGEMSSSMDSLFYGCTDLRNVILPEGVSAIQRFAFNGCDDLGKLYIPESVTDIEKEAFQGNTVNVYGQEGSAAETIQDENVNFISLKNHEHVYKKVTFFSFDTWAVTGDYCEECGKGENIEKISWIKGKSIELPEQAAVQPASHECPLKRSLDDADTDEYGIVYTLDPSTMTAAVQDINTDQESSELHWYISIPETVESDGEVYCVTKLKRGCFQSTRHIVLPDTIETLEAYCFSSPRRYSGVGTEEMFIELGSNIKNIDDKTFSVASGQVRVSYRNGVSGGDLICENGVVLNADRTKLYRYCNFQAGEYTIPASVKYIMGCAFAGNGEVTGLRQINIQKQKTLQIDQNAFNNCNAYINYMDVDDSDTTASPVPTTAASTAVPTASPSAVPTTSPTPSPTRAPIILPTQKPSEESTASPSIVPTASPSAVPIMSPSVAPTASPTQTPSAILPSITPSPTRAPIILPTQKPSEEPTASPSPEPTANPAAATPAVPDQQPQTPIVSSENERKESIKLLITGLCLSYNEKSVSITWKQCRNAEFYRIYRAERKGKYRLIQVLTGMKTGYVDKKVNPAKRYYYKISAVGIEDGKLREGAARSKSITIPGLEKPVIKVKKGKTDLVRYISVILKKYGGTHAQVYMSLNGKKYTKLKMTSGKIVKFRGTFRFQCKLRRKVLWLKVRTYKRNKKGRTYSGFSKAAKIRV